MKDKVLALAEELDGVSFEENCDQCLACGTALCRGDVECAESVHKACAKRLREIVEHDACEDTTVSAYDLLSEEDRKALAWVREMGGVEAAEKRLMPEGMEWLIESWPRFDDNEPLRWDDEYANGNGGVSPLRYVSLYADGRAMLGKGKVKVVLAPGQRVKRPAVLAADGEPLEVGQTVYATHYGYVKCTVLAIEWVVDGYLVEVENEGGHKFRQTPDEFTHQRPVLDADGVPIREGDTVWMTGESEYSWTVTDVSERHVGGYCNEDGSSLDMHSKSLTHAKPEQPDTWERLEHDAEKTVCEYFGANYDCADCPLESARCAEEVKKDIIRRAKKLAERGER